MHLGSGASGRVIGPGAPLTVVGYSNGGTLAVKYAMDALERGGGAPRGRLVLISPMIGVSPFAGVARLIGPLGVVPISRRRSGSTSSPNTTPSSSIRFRRTRRCSRRLTRTLHGQIVRLGAAGRLGGCHRC